MDDILDRSRLFTSDADAVAWARSLESKNFYFTAGGRIIRNLPSFLDENANNTITFYVHRRLLGGKGGFGSMLRSFRVNRSTNQLMCRDLNGRRVATVEEEKKLRQWLQKTSEREKKKLDKKKAKIEKLKSSGTAKHQFNDPDYIRQKEDILEKTEEAFEHGFEHFKKRRLEETSQENSSDSDLDLDEYGHPLQKRKKVNVEREEKLEEAESDDSENECDPELLKEIQDYFEHKPVAEEPTCSKQGTTIDKIEENPGKVKDSPFVYNDIDLDKYGVAEELEKLGLEHLKHCLKERGLKCGGSVQERAARLFSVRKLKPADYPKNLLAKK